MTTATAPTKPEHSWTEPGMAKLLRETVNFESGSNRVILESLLNAARNHAGMEVAFISEFRGGQRVFRHVDTSDGMELIREGGSDPEDKGYCKKVVNGQLPELIHNAQANEVALEIPATREIGIGAHMSTPIRLADGSVFGTFCCFSTRPDESLNERDMGMLHAFADITGDLLQHELDLLREKERKRARIADVLDTGALTAVWQPIVCLDRDSWAGVEALARFPDGPWRGPAEWFEAAASVDSVADLERHALRNGLQLLACLPATMKLTCNATAASIINGIVAESLSTAPLDRVVLEITEHAVVEDYDALNRQLQPLRDRGLHIAVDDAGAGYASFRHILKLRPEVIKLDMSLTRDIDSDISRRSLAGALVTFAQEIDSRLIAEGVETSTELDTLTELGVEFAQGFHLHRPQTIEGLIERCPTAGVFNEVHG